MLVALAVLGLSVTAAGSAAAGRSDGSRPASAQLQAAVREVPVEALDAVGRGKVYGQGRWRISRFGTPSAGLGKKVHVVTYNAAWCPHCAADSWPLAIALSRFGAFGGLRTIDTGTFYGRVAGAKPSYPHTEGLSFFDASYRSPLIDFKAVVAFDRDGHPLQKLTGPALKAVKRFDPKLGVPAVAIGDVYGFLGSGYDPARLAGESPMRIVKAAADPTSPIGQAVDGEANVITAALCVATGEQPPTVCEDPGVVAAAARVPAR